MIKRYQNYAAKSSVDQPIISWKITFTVIYYKHVVFCMRQITSLMREVCYPISTASTLAVLTINVQWNRYPVYIIQSKTSSPSLKNKTFPLTGPLISWLSNASHQFDN